MKGIRHMGAVEDVLGVDRRKFNRLSAKAEGELLEAVKAAQEECDSATAEARDEFNKATASHQRTLDAAVKPAEQKRDAAVAAAKKTFGDAIAKARTDSGYEF